MKNEQLNLNTPRNWMKYLLLWAWEFPLWLKT